MRKMNIGWRRLYIGTTAHAFCLAASIFICAVLYSPYYYIRKTVKKLAGGIKFIVGCCLAPFVIAGLIIALKGYEEDNR